MENSTNHYLFNGVFPWLIDNEFRKGRDILCLPQKESEKEQQLQQALKDSETRYALATQITNDGLWEWNLSSNQIYFSCRWKAMIGCSEQGIKNNPIEWLARVHATNIQKLRDNIAACWIGEIPQFEIEYSLLHQDGTYRLMYCKCIAVKNDQGVVQRLVGSQTDITERRQIEDQLNHQAVYDRLTKIPNRQLFIQKLKELSQLPRHPEYLFGILYLDLDRFQQVNHNFGHSIGDLLLVEIVERLKCCLRTQDLIARLGGDEFAILLLGYSDLDYSLEVASLIQKEFSLPIKVGDCSILITTSIGIACIDNLDTQDPMINLIELLQNAEIAMHEAKAKGKARSIVFEPVLHRQNLEHSKSKNDLREAIEQEQFELHYQPIVKLDDQQLIGFEALIRWQHPTRGLVYPADFIPLAEDTGLIVPIGWWVLGSACQQMALWQQQYQGANSVFISVNITAKQFSQPYAGDIIAQILDTTGLDPHCLKLEITESDIIKNIDAVRLTVEKLKILGVQLSMDDFGTGYSSLSYLHSLPVDTLKIDRSFIQNLDSDRSVSPSGNRHQLELIKTIIKLAEVFNLDLIAEGIEREEQCQLLLDLQCKYGQGYLFSKPLSSIEASNLFLSN
ncbi:diguanylate cyclase/phosphodiesterase with PAS/PAC and GAF domains [Chondrocystis sp. NIES-4102]|nr:diguanylate cyclase/phosphodiesterase with PAS/PAC and GAF domains [Chondrocystis sp. NIES-4102]